MANNEHVRIALRGREAIDKWRKDSRPEEIFDLSHADLQGAKLGGAVLAVSDLSEANLSGADLIGAKMRAANLEGARLCRAKLHGAHLADARMSMADLSDAMLPRVNLNGADISKAELHGARLSNAQLVGTKLSGANLTSVDLSNASLRDADLSGADLTSAKLEEATVTTTDLSNADLTESRLSSTLLVAVAVDRTRFHGASTGRTSWGSLDLSEALGLESVTHLSPSVIGTDVLVRSKGRIPATFLRGCGLADWEIEHARLYDPALPAEDFAEVQNLAFEIRFDQGLQFRSLFISYSHEDSEFVDCLEPLLVSRGIRFWRDIHDAPAGPLDPILDFALRTNPVALVVLSERSVESEWVKDEIDRALALKKEWKRETICPVSLDEAWLASGLPRKVRTYLKDTYNVLKFSGWQHPPTLREQFSKLVKGLNLFYRDSHGSAPGIALPR